MNSYLVTTIAGAGIGGYSGDGGAATSAKLTHPYTLCDDSASNLYIGDSGNSRIRSGYYIWYYIWYYNYLCW